MRLPAALLVVSLAAAACAHADEFAQCEMAGRDNTQAIEECRRNLRESKAARREAWRQREQDGNACARSDAQACFRAAVFDEKQEQLERAMTEYDFACYAGMAEACARVAALIQEGVPRPR